LPVGSIITNLDTEEKWQLTEEGQKILLLKGGYGGFGNEHFKSSVNTTPQESRPGAEGEKGIFQIELELFCWYRINWLAERGEIFTFKYAHQRGRESGDYGLTTLDPNLGDFYGYIIADIPGIIEGASEGKASGWNSCATSSARKCSRTLFLLKI